MLPNCFFLLLLIFFFKHQATKLSKTQVKSNVTEIGFAPSKSSTVSFFWNSSDESGFPIFFWENIQF
jgi:hypothetical protein